MCLRRLLTPFDGSIADWSGDAALIFAVAAGPARDKVRASSLVGRLACLDAMIVTASGARWGRAIRPAH